MASKTNSLHEFRQNREEMNEKIMDLDHLGIKRFFNLDHKRSQDGVLSAQTKDLLASTVLRCNDCIDHYPEEGIL